MSSSDRAGKYESISNFTLSMGLYTCMHCTQLPFGMELLQLYDLREKKMRLLRPEEAFTEDEDSANAAGVTAAEAAKADAIAAWLHYEH